MMRKKSSDLIFGIRADQLRLFFKNTFIDEFTIDHFKEKMDLTKEEAENKITQMLDKKIIVKRKTPGPPAQYRLLTKGLAIKNVKFIEPILREKADQLVKELIERIKVLNADDYYIMCVEELYVFGSYNSNSKDCGDIDLAFDLKRKRHLTREEIVKLGHERAPKSFNFLNSFNWPISEEPYRFLKNRNKYLNFHSKLDGEQVGKLKLIWKRN